MTPQAEGSPGAAASAACPRRARTELGRFVDGRSPRRRQDPGLVVVLAALLALSLAALGCGGGDDIVFPEDEEPFVYLVLNEIIGPTGEPVQPAFLLTLVSPDSARYLTADRFEMRRVSDGARYDWRNESLFSLVPFDQGTSVQLFEGNYLLRDSTTSRGLGRRALEPGGTYELRVEAAGRVIRGRVTIPDTFGISLVERDDGDVVAVWPDVEGAAGYSVEGTGDEIFRPVFQADTTWDVRPGTLSLTVRAADPHAFRYLTDDDARRAGVEGALGVFGAIQTAEVP